VSLVDEDENLGVGEWRTPKPAVQAWCRLENLILESVVLAARKPAIQMRTLPGNHLPSERCSKRDRVVRRGTARAQTSSGRRPGARVGMKHSAAPTECFADEEARTEQMVTDV
jgi:hypothetical protein